MSKIIQLGVSQKTAPATPTTPAPKIGAIGVAGAVFHETE